MVVGEDVCYDNFVLDSPILEDEPRPCDIRPPSNRGIDKHRFEYREEGEDGVKIKSLITQLLL
jgi:hypothetical protein